MKRLMLLVVLVPTAAGATPVVESLYVPHQLSGFSVQAPTGFGNFKTAKQIMGNRLFEPETRRPPSLPCRRGWRSCRSQLNNGTGKWDGWIRNKAGHRRRTFLIGP